MDTICAKDPNTTKEMWCSPDRLIGVITVQNDIIGKDLLSGGLPDGLMGLGRIIPGDSDPKTQFVAGLVDESDPNLIQKFTAFLDLRSEKISFGAPQPGSFKNKTL